MYEGKHVFLEAYRVGLKLNATPDSRLDLFAGYRFESFPYDRIPASLAGMANRDAGADLGVRYQLRKPWGTFFGELLHDAVLAAGAASWSRVVARYARP